MSPCPPTGDIKVSVPRHNAQRIGAKLKAEVEKAAKSQKKRADATQPSHDTAIAQAIESASEWNSLLMTARAERGPQWDVGTQQFLVDEGSDLYYDATPLLEVQQQERGEEPRSRRGSNPMQPNMHDPFMPNPHGQPSPHRMPSSGQNSHAYPYGGSPTSSRFPGQGGFNSVAPGQFYNGRDNGSPVRMGMGHDAVGGAGGMGRRVTRGSMADEAFHGI